MPSAAGYGKPIQTQGSVVIQQTADFSVDALYNALEQQRSARALSWQQVAREVNALFAGTSARPISASTLTGMRSRTSIEGDGILQMLRWLHRTPESFISGRREPSAERFVLPNVDVDHILRFDAMAIHSALDARRAERGLTWTQVAAGIGWHSAAGLTRLSRGGRVAFPQVMRIVTWLERPAADFTRVVEG